MSPECNKTVVRRLFEEVYNGGNVQLADELLDTRYVGYNPLPGQSPGVDGDNGHNNPLRANRQEARAPFVR